MISRNKWSYGLPRVIQVSPMALDKGYAKLQTDIEEPVGLDSWLNIT